MTINILAAVLLDGAIANVGETHTVSKSVGLNLIQRERAELVSEDEDEDAEPEAAKPRKRVKRGARIEGDETDE